MKIARDAYKALKGIVCTYKPPECSTKYVETKLRKNICRDLNNLEASFLEAYLGNEKHLLSNKKTDSEKEECLDKETYLNSDIFGTELSTDVKLNYADNVLCSGPRYRNNDVEINAFKPLGDLASGVLIVAINGEGAFLKLLHKLSFTKCYHLKGILGQVTKNFHISEKVLAKAKYDHVTKVKFDMILASYQSAALRRVFGEYGKPLQSQEAYNFAVQCLQRPHWNGPPILYSLKIVDFEPPDFTIEIHCANETQEYLLNLIHNLGVSLKSYATCTQIRCIRQGCFHVEHALVKQQWNLTEILGNLSLCWKLFEQNFPKKKKDLRLISTVKPSHEEFRKFNNSN